MSLLPSKSMAVWQSEFLWSSKSRFFFSLTGLVLKEEPWCCKVAERHREKLAMTRFLSMKRRGSLTLEILHSSNYLIATGKPYFIIDLVTGERLKVTACNWAVERRDYVAVSLGLGPVTGHNHLPAMRSYGGGPMVHQVAPHTWVRTQLWLSTGMLPHLPTTGYEWATLEGIMVVSSQYPRGSGPQM